MTDDGSAGSPQADDRGISNMGLRVSDLNRSSLKFEIVRLRRSRLEVRNSKSEIASHLGIHYTTVSKVIKEMED